MNRARITPGVPTALALFGLSAAVRCIYVWVVADHPAVRLPTGDSLAYHGAALRILGGDWLGNEAFYQDPLYPYLLAILYAVFGVGSIGVLFAQSVLDSISIVLIYATARELFDDRTALLAGLLAALYRVAWFYDALLLKVPLTLLLASLTAYLLVRADARRRAAAWFWAGGALGLAALTRGNYLLFVPILGLWVAARTIRTDVSLAIRSVCALGAGLVVAIGPVTLRNYVVADDFVLITSQAGQNFYIGNFRDNDSGVYKAPPFVIANAAHEQRDFRDEAERREGRPLEPSELSRFWFREAFREIEADPAHFARHALRKLKLLLNHYEIPDNQSFAFFAEHVTWLLEVPTPGFGILFPIAVAGAWLSRRERGAVLLMLFFASYAASVLLFFNVSRYRIPALPSVFVLAGYAVSRSLELVRDRKLRQLAIPAGLVVAALLLTQQNLIEEDFALFRSNLGTAHARRAEAHHERSTEWTRRGDRAAAQLELDRANALWDAAEEQYRHGLDSQKQNPRLRSALRRLLETRIARAVATDRLEEALELAQRLTATFPRYAAGHAQMGEVLEARLEFDRAERAYSQALGISADRRARAGLARIRRGQRGETADPPMKGPN